MRLVESDLPVNDFPKSNRLLKSNEFQRVFAEGHKLVTDVIIFRYAPSNADSVRIGLTVSRKVGNAVTRNLIKRRMREAFRLVKHRFPVPIDIILSPRRGITDKSFQDYQRCFDQLVRKLEKRRPSRLS